MRALFVTIAFVFCATAIAKPSTRYAVTAVTITDIGTLGGTSATALDINGNGEIVGWADTVQGRRHAFVYRGGLMEDIGALFGTNDSEAHGNNNPGSVVGTIRNPSVPSSPQAFYWVAG